MMPLGLTIQILLGFVIASALMTGLWIVQRRTHTAGIVDAGWAAGVGVLAVLFAATSGGYLPRRILVAVLIGTWALRLAAYLVVDRIRDRPEDGRYASMRRQWGDAAERRFFVFFQYQAVFVVFFSLPALVVSHSPQAHWTGWDVAGALIWFLSVGNTVLADRQLADFRARATSRGKTCRQGWWRYSRHPNYFFEWLHWWSYAALAAGSAYWWVALMVPAAMLYLLFRVTGIPPTEMQALISRGDDYREYQRTTSVFFPWFPKRGVGAD
jgi:steroid 5-alpha reductase family enzyme